MVKPRAAWLAWMQLSTCPSLTTINAYDKVYVAADGTYTNVAASNKLIGYAFGTLAAPGVAPVALANA